MGRAGVEGRVNPEPAHTAAQDHRESEPFPNDETATKLLWARAVQRAEESGRINVGVEDVDESVRDSVR